LAWKRKIFPPKVFLFQAFLSSSGNIFKKFSGEKTIGFHFMKNIFFIPEEILDNFFNPISGKADQ
jgi:hypothetical protein